MDDVRNVIIIGSGPAGYTAAIYAARASLTPLVFEGSVTAGGALMNTTDVENYPGFPEGVMGPDLMDHLRKQAERFGAELVTDDVTAVDLTGEVKVVTDGSGVEHRARTVIIATGSGYRELGLHHEKRLSGRGVSWCATCDGFFFKDQDIAVVGGGDTAMEEATFLTRFARSVTIVHRRDSLRASKIMQERAFSNEKIRFLWDSEVIDVVGESKVEALTVRNLRTGEESRLEVTGLFVAIGHDPRSELFEGQVRPGRGGLPAGGEPHDPHQPGRRVRLRRRRRPQLPAGDHRGRHRLFGRPRRRALPHRAGGRLDDRRPGPGRPGQRRLSQPDIRTPEPNRTTRTAPRGAPVGAKSVTDETFIADVLQSEKTVLVDFWAEWCGPCRQVSPILEEIANEHADKLEIVKLNVDENPRTAADYGITSIPTMNVYAGGEVVKSIVGAKPKAMLLRDLDAFI